MADSPQLNPNRRHRASPERYPLRVPTARLFSMASLHGDALVLATHGKVHIAKPGTPGETCIMSISRWMRSLVSAVVCGVLWGAPGHACHGELPNRPLLPA